MRNVVISLVLCLLSGGCNTSTSPSPGSVPASEPKVSSQALPLTEAAWESLGDQAAASGQWQRAVECYQQAISLADSPSQSVLDKLGQQWMNVGRPFESLAVLERAISLYPNSADLRTKMVALQASLGLQWEADVHLRWLIQRGFGNLALLTIAADLSRPQTVESTCRYALQHYPSDQRPQYSIARVRAAYNEWQDVADQLKPVVVAHPTFIPAQAYYLRALVELDRQPEIDTLLATLGEEVQSHPQYWLAAGVWAQRQNEVPQAALAYWRAAKLNENDGETLTRLASALATLGRQDASLAVAKRAANLTALRDAIDSLRNWQNDSQTAAIQIAQTLTDLGRLWEATAWLQVGFQMRQNLDPRIKDIYRNTRSQLTATTPWQAPEMLVAGRMDLADLPPINWTRRAKEQTPSQTTVASSIALCDVAAEQSLEHVCKIATSTGIESGIAIYQSGAGGAGVIDFDLDGWSDVYLTVMDGTPRRLDSGPNRLYRNANTRFLDVTPLAGVGDRGFAQGVAVGDYNGDGWPDLYVANIGANQLYRNNGDGTFTETTNPCGIHGNDWTTSVAIADIDGDAHADLVDVGYCSGDYVLEHQCMDQKLSAPRSCGPLAFEAQSDRVWRGLGDGCFVDASEEWLAAHEPGRGFGLVVGQLDATPGIEMYIANDMTANHYWSVDPHAAEPGFRLTQQAAVRGLAVNEQSLSQASMGIAAADADRDGDLDFLLTHFSGDYNTYYEQVQDGLWVDHSKQVELAQPSMSLLGYGTQWIDLDNDGSLELFTANGDIDDFSHVGRVFRQSPQLFSRSAAGRYQEVPSRSVGDYFTRQHLGRAVVTWDANRDGRQDLLVTHLFEPVSLLSNQTQDAGQSIRFILRGTASHRDAVGSRVTIKVGNQSLTGYVIAGDGYQCSCERYVTFGVDDAEVVNEVVVHWPHGEQSQYAMLASGHDYLLIEGTDDAFELLSP